MAGVRTCAKCGRELSSGNHGKYCLECLFTARSESSKKNWSKLRSEGGVRTQKHAETAYTAKCRSGCRWWTYQTKMAGNCDRYLLTGKRMGGTYEEVRAWMLAGTCPHFEKISQQEEKR